MKEYSYLKRRLMRLLSEDASMSVTRLAKELRCSRNTVINNMKILDSKFGILYTVEFDIEAMGFSQKHVLRVKFGNKPKLSDIKEIFKDDELVRMVAMTEGDFDMLVDVMATSGDAYGEWGVKTVLKLLPYRPTIKPSLKVLVHTGFMPMTETLLRHINLSRLGLDETDRRILLILNRNCRSGHKLIARELRLNSSTVRYRMRKIYKTGIIKRFTATLQRPPTGNNVAFFVNYRFAPGIVLRYSKARDYYTGVDGSMPFINTFQFLALTSGSSILFGLGCFESEEDAIEKVIMEHKRIYKEDSPSIAFARIAHVVKGTFPVRNMDFVKDYKAIKWMDMDSDKARKR